MRRSKPLKNHVIETKPRPVYETETMGMPVVHHRTVKVHRDRIPRTLPTAARIAAWDN